MSQKCGKKVHSPGLVGVSQKSPVAELECDNCRTRVMHEGALATHRKSCVAIDSMPKSVECDICGKMVADQGHLTQHNKHTHPTFLREDGCWLLIS